MLTEYVSILKCNNRCHYSSDHLYEHKQNIQPPVTSNVSTKATVCHAMPTASSIHAAGY